MVIQRDFHKSEAMDDPTEEELASAVEKIEVMVEQQKTQLRIFYVLQNLGALPAMASGQTYYIAQTVSR